MQTIKPTSTALERLNAERLAALVNLDVDYWRDLTHSGSNDFVALVGLHKARYERAEIADELRHISRGFLTRQGFRRMNNWPWPPEGELPE